MLLNSCSYVPFDVAYPSLLVTRSQRSEHDVAKRLQMIQTKQKGKTGAFLFHVIIAYWLLILQFKCSVV